MHLLATQAVSARVVDGNRGNAGRARSGFTLPEVLVVCGIIAALAALLLPALSGGLRTAQLAKSQTRLKNIATFMTAYSSENREYIVPSQFDYTAAAAISPVKVRSMSSPPVGQQYKGTWADILWTYSGQKVVDAAAGDRYMFDSPDSAYYAANTEDDSNVFRSVRPNTRNSNGDGIATPFGTGAHDIGQPGFFAANNFFNTDPNAPWAATQPPQWWVTGQIKAPERSMYLVDSLAGETIDPDGVSANSPWRNTLLETPPSTPNPCQVDFRYTSSCLMLFLDGHSQAEATFVDLAEVERRQIKVRNLHQN